MNRTLINFWLNGVLLVVFLAVLWLTTVLHFVFPPGPDAVGWTLWGMNYVEWRGLQFGCVAALGLGVLVHVMLHWSWVCGVIATKIVRSKTRPDDGLQTIYGVGFLIGLLVVLGVSAAAAFLTIEQPPIGRPRAASSSGATP